jgi:hypothetical protein
VGANECRECLRRRVGVGVGNSSCPRARQPFIESFGDFIVRRCTTCTFDEDISGFRPAEATYENPRYADVIKVLDTRSAEGTLKPTIGDLIVI